MERLTEAARYGLSEVFDLPIEEVGKRAEVLLGNRVRRTELLDPQEARRQQEIQTLAKNAFQNELNRLAELFSAEPPKDTTECLDRSELMNFDIIEKNKLRHLSHCLVCIWRLMKMPKDLCL